MLNKVPIHDAKNPRLFYYVQPEEYPVGIYILTKITGELPASPKVGDKTTYSDVVNVVQNGNIAVLYPEKSLDWPVE